MPNTQNIVKAPPNGHTVERLAQQAYVIHHEATIAFIEAERRTTPRGWDNLSLPEKAAWEAVVMELFRVSARPERAVGC